MRPKAFLLLLQLAALVSFVMSMPFEVKAIKKGD
jgi:hypothetical protein